MAKIHVLNNPDFKAVKFDWFKKQMRLLINDTGIKSLEAGDK